MSNNEKFRGVKETMLVLAGLPEEIIGKNIVFEGQALDPSIAPGRMDIGKVKHVEDRGQKIGEKCYYYLILTTDRGQQYTYCGFGDFWHFEQDGKIFVGKIVEQNEQEKKNGGNSG